MTDAEFDKAVAIHERRQSVFIAEGMTVDNAFDLAEQMYERDRDPQDDRHLCFECRHYSARLCTGIRDRYGKPTTPTRFILQRCDKFSLKGPKPLTDEERNQIDASNQHQERDE